jgi:hypothetical protein
MPKKMELEGKDIAGVRVLTEVDNDTGAAGTLWLVRFPCKHEAKILGGRLGDYGRKGLEMRCKECPAAADKTAHAPRAKAPKSAPRKGPEERPAPPAPALSGPTESKSYEFPLRRGFGVTVTLPVDLTTTDVHRFMRWLETLVFDDAPAAAE